MLSSFLEGGQQRWKQNTFPFFLFVCLFNKVWAVSCWADSLSHVAYFACKFKRPLRREMVAILLHFWRRCLSLSHRIFYFSYYHTTRRCWVFFTNWHSTSRKRRFLNILFLSFFWRTYTSYSAFPPACWWRLLRIPPCNAGREFHFAHTITFQKSPSWCCSTCANSDIRWL